MVLVRACTEERQGTTILLRALGHEPPDLEFGEAGWHARERLRAQFLRNLVEERLDRWGADRREHLADVVFGVRNERHDLSLTRPAAPLRNPTH